jgi:hypothetical protein
VSDKHRTRIVDAALAAGPSQLDGRNSAPHAAETRVARSVGIGLDQFTGGAANIVPCRPCRTLRRQAQDVLKIVK